jgi:CheY-like chemotaxis protein
MHLPELILMVDDDADDRQFFKEALHEIYPSIECSTANDGIEALEFLKSSKRMPDFIFLDLNMPRMDGKKCLVEIKKNKRLTNIPVIIYSTSKHEEDEKETFKLGASAFLKKPYTFEEICNIIASVIQREWSENHQHLYL